MTSTASPDDFDVAKAVFDKLKDLPTERRDRVLRWVAEGLGTTLSANVSPPAASAGHIQTPALLSLEAHVAPHPSASGSGVDIKTFVISKAPKSDTQFATAVAYYYRFEAPPAQRKEAIDGETLQEAARLAGRARVTNPRFTLNNAKAAGYLDGDAKSGFSINTVGENLVAMTLPGGSDKPTPRPRKAKTATAKRPNKKK